MKIILSLVVGAAVIVVVAILTISYNQIDWLSLSKQNYVVEVEHFKLIISIVSTSITFLAVLVALFKEDLRELWNRPIIDIVVPDKSTIEETSEVTDRVGIYEAQRYISRVKIKK